MKAGAIGKCPELEAEVLPSMMVLPKNKMAILIDEMDYPVFDQRLTEHPEIQTIFIVTDSESDFCERTKHYNGKDSCRLNKSYLESFKINLDR